MSYQNEMDQISIDNTFRDPVIDNCDLESATLSLPGKVPREWKSIDVLLQVIHQKISQDMQLLSLMLSDNDLTGTITWNLLPKRVRMIDVSNNDLSGKIQDLPSHLTALYLQNNKFDDVDWNGLPSELVILSIQDNPIDIEITWKSLPSSLKILVVPMNVADKSMFNKPPDWQKLLHRSERYIVFQRIASD